MFNQSFLVHISYLREPTMEALLNYDAEFHARLSELVKGNRKLIIDEIARIESSYCNFLRILIENYVDGFAEANCAKKVKSIFTNVKQIFEIHSNIQIALEEIEDPKLKLIQISSVYSYALSDIRKVYLGYYKNYLKNMGILKETRSYSTDFNNFLNVKRNQCGKDIASLLRLPILQIVRYQYLFSRLEKYTEPQSLEAVTLRLVINELTEINYSIDKNLYKDEKNRKTALEGMGSCSELHILENNQLSNTAQETDGWNMLILGDDDHFRSKTYLQNYFLKVLPFQSDLVSPSFHYIAATITLEPPLVPSNQELMVRVWDSTGFENYAATRLLNYTFIDIYFLCFRIDSKEQFSNIVPKWYKETKLHLRTTPYILVGLGSELRQSVDPALLIPELEGKNLANLLSVPYFECSYVTGEGIKALFYEAASLLVNSDKFESYKEIEKDVDDATEKILANILDEHLNLSFSELGTKAHFPKEIKYCSNLTSIDLSWNGFTKVPLELKDILSLRKLNLASNKLTDVNGIETMTQLVELDLSNNSINYLPIGLGHCTNLVILNLKENPLETIPKDIFSKKYFNQYKSNTDRSQLYSYLRSIQEGGQAPHHRVKVMLVGDGEVGKTSLLNCFMESTVNQRKKKSVPTYIQTITTKPLLYSSSATSTTNSTSASGNANPAGGFDKAATLPADGPKITDGIDISEVVWINKQDNDREIYWDCWDYAGQEIYYTTHQFFLSSGAVYLICFKLLNRDFSRIEYWLNSVHTRARGSPIILVGTHADNVLCTESYISNYVNELKSRYLKRFKNSLGAECIKYIITLSTKQRKGIYQDEIKQLMDKIGSIMVTHKLVGKTYPKSWLGLEKHLRSLSKQPKQDPFISWQSFTNIAINCQISAEDVSAAAAFLHSSGVICYFNDEHSGLSDLVILDPQFLTNVFSSVISLRSNFISNGEILASHLLHIWKGFDVKLHNALMVLLEKFEIVFPLPTQEDGLERYVVPSLLPDAQPPNYSELWGNIDDQSYQLGRIYQFKFLPLGFFSRLFVRILHLPKMKAHAYWQNGIILSFDEERALIRYNPTEYKLTMNVRGEKESPCRGQLLRLLIENVETIIEGWYETDVDIYVPCVHCVEIGSYSPYLFTLEECIHQVTTGTGQPFVWCRGLRRVRIDALAPDISFTDMRTKRVDFKDIQLSSVIGLGAFGKVYSGKWNDQLVAIKILENQKKEQFSELEEPDAEEYKRFNEFQREVWIMSCIKHQNLVQLKCICANPPAMIMELLPLGDLYHMLYPKPPSNLGEDDLAQYKWSVTQQNHHLLVTNRELRLRIALDIAKGMKYLHSLSPPIIHRDLRSPNIFMTSLSCNSPTVAKVGDFGLSRFVATTLAGGDFNYNWLAPEVMKSDPYTEKMDVYSFAIICNELISLQAPFEEYDHIYQGKPRNVFKRAVVNGLRPTIPDDCPPEFSALIQECWKGNPDDRPSFATIVPRFTTILKELGYNVVTEEDAAAEDSPISLLPSQSMNEFLAQKTNLLEFDSRLEPRHPHSVQCLLLVGDKVWVGCRSGIIRIWERESSEVVEDFKAHSSGIYAMQLVSGYVWTASEDGSIHAFDINSGNKESTKIKVSKPVKGRSVRSLLAIREFSDFGPNSKHVRVLSGDTSGIVTIWKVKKKAPSKRIPRNVIAALDSVITCMYQDNNLLWIGLQNNIAVFDLKMLKVIATFPAHTGPVNGLACFGCKIWSVGNDGVCIWDSNPKKLAEYQNTKTPEHKICAHTARVLCIERVGNYMVSGSFDTGIILYDAKTFEVLQEEKYHKDGVRSLLSITNNQFWSGSMQRDGTICIWNIKTCIVD